MTNNVKKNIRKLDLIGNKLCLDFINTAGLHSDVKPVEYLNSYHDLIIWSRQIGLITHSEYENLYKSAARFDKKARNILKQAIELREMLYRIFSSIVKGAPVKKKALVFFNKNFSKAVSNSQIIQERDGFFLDFLKQDEDLEWVLYPIIQSAYELLMSDELKKVKMCADTKCGWLFFDKSKNQSRLWCDMKDCGNRAKAHRFRKKKKK